MTEKPQIRLLLVDDENVVREGFAAILRLQDDMMVVGEATNGLEAVEVAGKTLPDIILLDLHMPKQDGLTSIPQLKAAAPACKILVLTSFAENDEVYQAVKAGALGFMLKDATRVQLLQAIHEVASGKASMSPDIAMRMIQEIDHPAHGNLTSSPLTRRELDTLKLIARGLSNNEIALDMQVHPRTVAKYVSSVLEKLQLASRTQAALYAVREGLAEPEV